jgi:hypothetical protein
VPAGWKDAAFRTLRAEGAFLVSAVRRDGRLVLVEIRSEKGGTCRLAGLEGPLAVRDEGGTPVQASYEGGRLSFPTIPGTTYRLEPAAASPPAPPGAR